jgi:hypothetical protein
MLNPGQFFMLGNAGTFSNCGSRLVGDLLTTMAYALGVEETIGETEGLITEILA